MERFIDRSVGAYFFGPACIYAYVYNLLVQIPYSSSTKAILRFSSRKRKRFLEFLSEKMSLQNNHTHIKYEQNNNKLDSNQRVHTSAKHYLTNVV